MFSLAAAHRLWLCCICEEEQPLPTI
jgi:hypothetical protein